MMTARMVLGLQFPFTLLGVGVADDGVAGGCVY